MIRVILEGLIKRHGRATAVDRASLEIAPGELMFVVGPGGAGKTSLARMIAGMDRADEGEIYFDDKLMNEVSLGERRVGLIARDGALWPGLTVAENVAYPLKSRKLSRNGRRDRTLEILNEFRVDTLADRTPDQLSPIQSLRVALARALITGPELLICDEPLGSLDPSLCEEFRGDLRRLQANHSVTILILTREIRSSLGLADRIAVMDLGRIVQVGPPQDLYNRPSDVFVARYLGPVNFLQGKVEGAVPNDSKDFVVRTPLGRLVGQYGGGPLAPGLAVTIAIRPEALAIGGTIPPGSNRFPATIERVTFQGELRLFQLRGPSEWPIGVVALQTQSRHLREGQNVTLSVSPEHVVILPGTYTMATATSRPELPG